MARMGRWPLGGGSWCSKCATRRRFSVDPEPPSHHRVKWCPSDAKPTETCGMPAMWLMLMALVLIALLLATMYYRMREYKRGRYRRSRVSDARGSIRNEDRIEGEPGNRDRSSWVREGEDRGPWGETVEVVPRRTLVRSPSTDGRVPWVNRDIVVEERPPPWTPEERRRRDTMGPWARHMASRPEHRPRVVRNV